MIRLVLLFFLVNASCYGQNMFNYGGNWLYNGKINKEAHLKIEETYARLKVVSEDKYYSKKKMVTDVYDSLGRNVCEYVFSDEGDTTSIYKTTYTSNPLIQYGFTRVKDYESGKYQSDSSKTILNERGLDILTVYKNGDQSRDSSIMLYDEYDNLILTRHFKITNDIIELDSLIWNYSYKDGLIVTFEMHNKHLPQKNLSSKMNISYLEGLVNEITSPYSKVVFYYDELKRVIKKVSVDSTGKKGTTNLKYYPNGLPENDGSYKIKYTYLH